MTLDNQSAISIAKQIKEDIDEYCKTTYDDGHRSHLGASVIGGDCKRKLWYIFRWCYKENFDGRMQRLFNRGHIEEARFIEWLEGIGCKVWERDTEAQPNENGEFPQFRISGVNGHFGGSMDGAIELPVRYGINEPILGEFKTNATGRGFNELLADGVAKAKPVHFAQMCSYGFKRGFNYALYMNICKNDDLIHVELVKLDHSLGRQMEEKAEQIITATIAPPRLSDNPTYFKCKWCAASDICHKGALVEKNCRSCKYAKPVENAEWFCNHHDNTIPKDFIPKGCDSYVSIANNVQT